jgi:hypothetical protein
MDYYKKYIKYKTKYIQLKNKLKGSGHGECKMCSCKSFSAENFNQNCICAHSYKNHNITISDWMIQIYNMDKSAKKYIKGDFCNIYSCKRCDCDRFEDNLINDKCAKCNHNVLNHCNTFMDIL